MKGRYKNLYTSQIISVYKRKSYKRNMMFLFAKLTKEIIFVCTIFLFLYAVTDLCMYSYICPALGYECSHKICLIYAHVESVKKAYEKGIQIALGTDAGTPFNYHSNTAYEMELLARLDISNMDILKMATINSARCVGVEKDYGSIEVGKQADLVCLNENPLENISNVRKINRVIQSGKIVIDNN